MITCIKVFNNIFFGVLVILSLLSAIAIVFVIFNLSNYYCLLSAAGFKIFICEFKEYADLFGATLAIFVAYLAIHSLNASTDASKAANAASVEATKANKIAIKANKAILATNEDKKKEDKHSDWKLVMEYAFLYSDKNDPLMKPEIIRVRRSFFDDLYKQNFKITSKDDLSNLFNKHFKNFPGFFERMNEKKLSKLSHSNGNAYSYDSFRYIFIRSTVDVYDGFENDLFDLYINVIKKSSL